MTPLYPVLFWASATLLAVLLVAMAYSYISLKIELRLLTRRAVTRSEIDARWAEMVTDLETLRTQVGTNHNRPPSQDWSVPERTPTALNLNRRGQILRLHGKGHSPAEIAQDLQISQGEVELLLKVHDWSATSLL